MYYDNDKNKQQYKCNTPLAPVRKEKALTLVALSLITPRHILHSREVCSQYVL
jgi:hypothetical protein